MQHANSVWGGLRLTVHARRYITATEWQTEWGGFKDRSKLPFNKLPLHCCAISFTPFEDPVWVALPQ